MMTYRMHCPEHGNVEFPIIEGSIVECPACRDAAALTGANLLHTFPTGATRSSETGKLDFEGFLSPLVLEEYARYMHACRIQDDGALRDSDNWQKGMDRTRYVKSAWRHFFDFWRAHRDGMTHSGLIAAMGLLFNIMGWVHETLKLYEVQMAAPPDYEAARCKELAERRAALGVAP